PAAEAPRSVRTLPAPSATVPPPAVPPAPTPQTPPVVVVPVEVPVAVDPSSGDEKDAPLGDPGGQVPPGPDCSAPAGAAAQVDAGGPCVPVVPPDTTPPTPTDAPEPTPTPDPTVTPAPTATVTATTTTATATTTTPSVAAGRG
ncbi:hypothetical protein, partial [Modestobacter versicolor]